MPAAEKLKLEDVAPIALEAARELYPKASTQQVAALANSVATRWVTEVALAGEAAPSVDRLKLQVEGLAHAKPEMIRAIPTVADVIAVKLASVTDIAQRMILTREIQNANEGRGLTDDERLAAVTPEAAATLSRGEPENHAGKVVTLPSPRDLSPASTDSQLLDALRQRVGEAYFHKMPMTSRRDAVAFIRQQISPPDMKTPIANEQQGKAQAAQFAGKQYQPSPVDRISAWREAERIRKQKG